MRMAYLCRGSNVEKIKPNNTINFIKGAVKYNYAKFFRFLFVSLLLNEFDRYDDDFFIINIFCLCSYCVESLRRF